MAKGLVKDSTLTAIANAIREKTETTATMLPSEMAALIQGITGAKVEYGTKTYSTTAKNITIEHSLGKIPNLIYLAQVGSPYNNMSRWTISLIKWPDDTTRWCTVSDKQFNGVTFEGDTNTNIYKMIRAEDKVTVNLTNYYFWNTYCWIVGVV